MLNQPASPLSKNSSSLKFAIFIDDFISHLYSLEGVAARLIKAGHTVVFFCPDKLFEQIKNTGFTVYANKALTTPRAKKRPKRSTSNQVIRNKLAERVQYVLFELNNLLLVHKPDLLILDPFILTFWPVFKLSGIPAIAVSTKPLLTEDLLVPPYTSGLIPKNTFVGRIAVKLSHTAQKIRYLIFMSKCLFHYVLYGQSERSLFLELVKQTNFNLKEEWQTRSVFFDLRFKSVPEIVLHALEFDFPRGKSLCGNVHFVGPCKDLINLTPLPELPEGEGPLIYISLGTVLVQKVGVRIKLYTKIIQVIESMPTFRAVIATADVEITQKLFQKFPQLSNRVYIKTWVARGSYLLKADAVIIHGGSNSVKEAILAMKPMLIIPHSADQPGMAARVVYHGLGKAIQYKHPKRIKEYLLDILNNPSIIENLNSMNRSFSKYDENNVCVETLLNAVRKKQERYYSS